MRVGVKPSGQNFTCCRAAKAPGKKVCGKSKKVVDKDTLFGYNIPCQQRRAAPDKPNNGDLHSGSAVDSDSTCGSSILSSPTRPQPNRLRYFRGIAQLVARLVRDEEAVGSNPAAPTKKSRPTYGCLLFCLSEPGFEQGGGMKCRKQSHSMALFSPRVPPGRKVYPGRSRNTFVYWSFFVFTAGFAAEATAACGGNREPRLGQRSARRECRSRHEADAG